MRHTVHAACILLLLLLARAAPLAALAAPSAVAPGQAEAPATVATVCPTFHWGAVEGASGYELVVMAADEEAPVGTLRRHLPAGATGWTPTLESCLAPGRYAWLVRAEGQDGPSAWSDPLVFEVAEPEVDVAAVLAALERHRATGTGFDGAGAGLASAREGTARPAGEQPGSAREGAAAAGGGSATALHGAIPDAAGETYGVRGVANSPDGAGVRADNDAGGADLLLGGSPAAALSESGFSRDSASDLTFDFSNPGTGSMTVSVDGTAVVTSATDQDTLGALSCAEGEVARFLTGIWSCAPGGGAEYFAGNQLELVGTTFNVLEGPTSGLDADLLDGLDSTAFLAAGADAWVDEAGDAMTGTLTLAAAGEALVTAGGAVSLHTTSAVTKGGSRFLWDDEANASFGAGRGALAANTTGGGNTALGSGALAANTTGSSNTAVGRLALDANVDGGLNAALGAGALGSLTSGAFNAALGASALGSSPAGLGNTAVGGAALQNATSGDRNLALGYKAGIGLTSGSDNIFIGNAGDSTDTGTIRIGSSQGATYVAGIRTAVGLSDTLGVVIDPAGRLGVGAAGGGGDADTLDGLDSTDFALVAHPHSGADITSGTVAEPRIDALIARDTEVLPAVLAGDGTGSGLDADLIDGLDSSAFLPAGADPWVDEAGDTMLGTLTLSPAAGTALATTAGDVALHDAATVTKGGARFLWDDAAGDSFAVGRGALAANTGDGNTAVGTEALAANTTGIYNTAVGRQAMLTNTTGNRNTAVGQAALFYNTSGYGNTSVGHFSMVYNTTGARNTAVGQFALSDNTTGVFNTAVGELSLNDNIGGHRNTGLGAVTLRLNTTGYRNTAVGTGAMTFNTTGKQNTALGAQALINNATGSGNVAVGYQAGSSTTGSDNISLAHQGVAGESGAIRIGTAGTHTKAFLAGVSGVTTGGAAVPVMIDASGQLGTAGPGGAGTNADTLDGLDSTDFVAAAGDAMSGALTIDVPSGFALQTAPGDSIDVGGDLFKSGDRILHTGGGAGNLGVGPNALSAVNNALWNTAVGHSALAATTSGGGNVALGYRALAATTSVANVAVGTKALELNTYGYGNTAVGHYALSRNRESRNTAVGWYALRLNLVGVYNVAVGMAALAANTEGDENTALGFNALANTTTAGDNTAVGSRALLDNQTGARNTAVGVRALESNTSGIDNTAVGYKALYEGLTGSRNIALGRRAGFATNGSDNILIGHEGVLGESGRIHLGTSGTHTTTFLVGDVGIETAPTNRLHVRDSINGAASVPNHVAQIENAATGNSPDVLVLKVGYTGVPGNGINFISFIDGNNTSLGSIQGNAAGGVELGGPGSDYAEWLPHLDPGEQIGPGDVVGLFRDRISRRTLGAMRAMVVSSGPIVAGNDPGEGRREGHARVAFVGQAPVKVRGPVRAGDLLVASGREDGTAISVPATELSAEQAAGVVGRALEDSEGREIELVRALVGLPDPAALLGLLADRDLRIESQHRELASLREELARLRGAVEALAAGTPSSDAERRASAPR